MFASIGSCIGIRVVGVVGMVGIGGTVVASSGAAVVAAMTAAGLQSSSEMVASKATSSASWVGVVFLFFKRERRGHHCHCWMVVKEALLVLAEHR